MKRIFLLLLLITSANFLFAQQKIKVDAMQLMQIQIAINPNDTAWRSFQMPSSQFKGIPIFRAEMNAPFYSEQQVMAIKNELEKILKPDKYFTTQEEYNKVLQSFSELGK